ncbi:M14 family zinc carboxypeptidase [Agaribacter flavus]|uniref:M14 family zinc carboxypeptidase n=1 Tax=Agaribacter flavus TaxID=1902781 RepID=A0ABV7FMZ7_9ALTE
MQTHLLVQSYLQDLYAKKNDPLRKAHIYPDDVEACISNIGAGYISHTVVGHSYESRPIHLISMGTGDFRIFAWSQMHGDEPTATASLIDFIEFVDSKTGREWFQLWKDKITLYLLPMLNPDGAAANTRENAQGMDINRDAKALQTPEGVVLNRLISSLQANLAFNLHDQNRHYTAGIGGKETLLAVMAPPPDENKTLTSARLASMQYIGSIVCELTDYIEGKIARYDDSYSYRSFGDFTASQNIPCMLIESGTEKDDPFRQQARKLNFLALSHATQIVAKKAPLDGKEKHYHNLPDNEEYGVIDVIFRGVNFFNDNDPTKSYLADIGLIVDENSADNRVFAVGDLSRTRAYREINCQGLHFVPGKTYQFAKQATLKKQAYLSLLKDGYLCFDNESHELNNQSCLPMVFSSNIEHSECCCKVNASATFGLASSTGMKLAVINAHIVEC